jgi:hypothetical protein
MTVQSVISGLDQISQRGIGPSNRGCQFTDEWLTVILAGGAVAQCRGDVAIALLTGVGGKGGLQW